MKEKTIKVLKVEPMKEPAVTHLKNDLKSLQEAVDGLIEIIPLGKGVVILDNEEAKLRNMQTAPRIRRIISEPMSPP